MSMIETDLDHRGVMTIWLSDEERSNALTREMVEALLGAFREADQDQRVRVVVVSNRGRVFCAGANLDSTGSPDSETFRATSALLGHAARSPKPYVGRIAGHCVAGGMGLAASLDIAVADAETRFGFTEVRVGVSPAMIAVVCLPKLSEATARAVFLRGHRFSAVDAAEMGLIAEAVPGDEVNDAVEQVVRDLLAGAPGALDATKRVLREVPGMGEDDAMTWTAALSAELFGGDEAREGIQAFLEKRSPSWAQ